MRILITGGNGQLGTTLQKVIDQYGFEAYFLDSSQLDITEYKNLKKVFAITSPEVTINTAAWTDVDGAEKFKFEARQVNVVGPKHLAEISCEFGSRLIHVSTDYVFSGENNQPWEVSDRMVPKTFYGITKAEGEKSILGIYPQGSYIFRTSWLYSPYRNNFAKTMARLALKNDAKVRVVDDQIGQPTSTIDLAIQILESVKRNLTPGVYHATNSGQATWKDFAMEVFRLVDEDPNRVVGINSYELDRPAIRPKYSVLSHKCWDKTDLAPMRDWREALAEQIDEIKYSVTKEGLA